MQKNLKKYAVLLLVIGIIALASLSVSDNNPLPKVQDFRTDKKQSAIGAYLAGQHAARKNDYSTASRHFLDSIEQNKGDSSLDENVLDLLLATGGYAEALKLADKVKNEESTSSAKLLLAANEIKNDNFKEANAILKSDSNIAEQQAIYAMLQAWAEIGLGNKKEALDIISNTPRGDYFNSIIVYNEALIAEIAGDNEKASKAYKFLLKNNKPTKRVAQSAYRFFKNSDDLASAKILFAVVNEGIDLKELQNLPSAKSGSADVLGDFAGIFLLQQNFAKAMMYYRLSLYIEPDDEETILLLGAILAHERDYEASNNVFGTIPESSKNYNAARIAQTQNYIGMENDIAATKLLKKLAENKDAKIEASVSLGDIARKKEAFADSNEYYSDAIEASKDEKNQQVYWPIYFARGVTYERLNKWEEAEADFQKALELKPEQADVLNYLAYSLLDMNFTSRFDEALNMLEIAYAQRPNDPHIIDSIGWAWFKKGDYAKAAKHLERAAEQMPYDPTINEHLGDVYWKSGREKEAFFAWERALQNDPEARFIKQLKNKLANGIADEAPQQQVEQPIERIELETKQENIDPSGS